MNNKFQKKELEKQFFNKLNGENFEPFDLSGRQFIYKYVAKFVPLKEGSKILDFGCGTGHFTQILLHHRLQPICFDLSFNCIVEMRRKYRLVKSFVSDGERAALKNSSFDAVFMCGILHHFPDPARILQETYRILKPEGMLFAIEPNLLNPFFLLFRCPKSPFYINKGVTQNECPVLAGNIRKQLAISGFSPTIFGISGVTFRVVDSVFLKRLVRLYNFYSTISRHVMPVHPFAEFLIIIGSKNSSPLLD